MPHLTFAGKRNYSEEEALALTGKMVVCDMKDCDGVPCKGTGKKPHLYDDVEDFSECNWPGKTGMSVPINQTSLF